MLSMTWLKIYEFEDERVLENIASPASLGTRISSAKASEATSSVSSAVAQVVTATQIQTHSSERIFQANPCHLMNQRTRIENRGQ